MKCLCGYEHEKEWEPKTSSYRTLKGEQEFTKVEGHFTVTKEYDYHPDEVTKVSLYACPQCGTVKLPDYF